MDLHVWKMKRRGEEQQKLIDSGGSLFGLKWLKQNLLSFVSYHDNFFELFTLVPDRGSLTSLVETVLVNGRPCWSPEGNQFYYSMMQGKCRRLMAKKVDDSDETELFPSVQGVMDYPSIDPSGDRIAFSLTEENNASIWIGDIENRKAFQFSLGTGKDILPSWSPDGTRLAFYRSVEDKWQLVVMDIESKKTLASAPIMDVDDQFSLSPSWSPSGRKLLAMNREKDGFSLKCLDTATGELTFLLHDRVPPLNPVYSDDGEWVYYFLREERREELWRMRLKDRKAERLANSRAVETLPQCCSKDNRIIFTRNGSLWLIDLEKQSRKELITLEGEKLFPTLSGDGSKLLFVSARGHNRDIFMLELAPSYKPE
jgi:Tol biopolymer transport system component